jgi:hypothetical protein
MSVRLYFEDNIRPSPLDLRFANKLHRQRFLNSLRIAARAENPDAYPLGRVRTFPSHATLSLSQFYFYIYSFQNSAFLQCKTFASYLSLLSLEWTMQVSSTPLKTYVAAVAMTPATFEDHRFWTALNHVIRKTADNGDWDASTETDSHIDIPAIGARDVIELIPMSAPRKPNANHGESISTVTSASSSQLPSPMFPMQFDQFSTPSSSVSSAVSVSPQNLQTVAMDATTATSATTSTAQYTLPQLPQSSNTHTQTTAPNQHSLVTASIAQEEHMDHPLSDELKVVRTSPSTIGRRLTPVHHPSSDHLDLNALLVNISSRMSNEVVSDGDLFVVGVTGCPDIMALYRRCLTTIGDAFEPLALHLFSDVCLLAFVKKTVSKSVGNMRIGSVSLGSGLGRAVAVSMTINASRLCFLMTSLPSGDPNLYYRSALIDALTLNPKLDLVKEHHHVFVFGCEATTQSKFARVSRTNTLPEINLRQTPGQLMAKGRGPAQAGEEGKESVMVKVHSVYDIEAESSDSENDMEDSDPLQVSQQQQKFDRDSKKLAVDVDRYSRTAPLISKQSSLPKSQSPDGQDLEDVTYQTFMQHFAYPNMGVPVHMYHHLPVAQAVFARISAPSLLPYQPAVPVKQQPQATELASFDPDGYSIVIQNIQISGATVPAEGNVRCCFFGDVVIGEVMTSWVKVAADMKWTDCVRLPSLPVSADFLKHRYLYVSVVSSKDKAVIGSAVIPLRPTDCSQCVLSLRRKPVGVLKCDISATPFFSQSRSQTASGKVRSGANESIRALTAAIKRVMPLPSKAATDRIRRINLDRMETLMKEKAQEQQDQTEAAGASIETDPTASTDTDDTNHTNVINGLSPHIPTTFSFMKSVRVRAPAIPKLE